MIANPVLAQTLIQAAQQVIDALQGEWRLHKTEFAEAGDFPTVVALEMIAE